MPASRRQRLGTKAKEIAMPTNTKLTVFITKWAKVYAKADMSECSNVLSAFEGDYKARARTDEVFRVVSDEAMQDMLMAAVKQLRK